MNKKENLFLGRNEDIQKLESLYFDGNNKSRRAAIVSGYPVGIGRRKLLTRFIIDKIASNKSTAYAPIPIELSDEQSIEDFIMQLNNVFLLYPQVELLRILASTKEEKLDIAVKLSNHMADKKERLLIRDNGVCVLSNGSLSTWFKELITSKELRPQLHFFLASQYYLRYKYNIPEVISMQIQPLNNQGAKALFYGYADLYENELDVSAEDADFFIRKSIGLPALIFKSVDLLRTSNAKRAKAEIDPIIKSEDKSIKLLIEMFKDKQMYLNVLIILSKFEFISYELLKKFTDGLECDIDNILYELYSYSVYETFGGNNQYLKINVAVGDYINRSQHELDTQLTANLKRNMQEFLSRDTDEFGINDLSSFLIGIQEKIKTNPKGVREKHLIPSVFLRVINDEYKKGTKKGNNTVINLCYRILEDSKKYYPEIVEDIRFWLCSALAKEQDQRFFEQIKYFSGYSELFLMGFYNRCGRKYKDAESFYKRALNRNNKDDRYNDRRHVTKAKHEMVIVLQKQGKYEEALELAKNNHETRPSNTYFIISYFRSLVRSQHPDGAILKHLMQELDDSLDAKRGIWLDTLKAEFSYYYMHEKFECVITQLKDTIRKAGVHKRIPYNSLEIICNRREAIGIASNIAKEYEINTIDGDDNGEDL